MKRYILYIIGILLPLLTACEMKKDLFGGGTKEEAPSYDNLGLLDIEIQAEREAELRADGSVSVEESNALKPDEFAIEIADSTGQVVKSFPSLAAMKEAGELLLPVGTYSVHAAYGADVNAGFNSPYYAGDTTCVIADRQVLKVLVRCVLQNKKVQFAVNEEFRSMFVSDYSIVVDNGTGILMLSKSQLGSAFFKNTGALRFSLYATTYEGQVHTYTCDLSDNEQVLAHNNIFVELGAVPTIPDQPGGVDPDEPDEPDEPDDPIEPDPEPDEPDESKPDVPVAPVIKVDVTLIEKDYVIEIPSNFVENSKPGTGNGDTPTTPGEGENTDPSDPGQPEESTDVTITGKIDGKSFDVNQTQTVSDDTKSVVINLYLPTGLEELTVDVSIGDIFLPLDLLDASAVAAINGILSGMGKTLTVPAKGSKGNLTFDISAFIGMLDTNNSFKLYVKDKNGKDDTATIKLTKK
ncbi:MAG: DUF4493 domain-containing protein [Parabacteroides sp.]|nr:DUF4493 domain-containing protein [Parabacteroides sp.]